jgi:hypothetical protein
MIDIISPRIAFQMDPDFSLIHRAGSSDIKCFDDENNSCTPCSKLELISAGTNESSLVANLCGVQHLKKQIITDKVLIFVLRFTGQIFGR